MTCEFIFDNMPTPIQMTISYKAYSERHSDSEYGIIYSDDAVRLIKTAWEKLDLCLHDYNIIILMSRSIAKLEGSAKIKTEHVAEAVHYRSLGGYLDNDVKPLKLYDYGL